MKDPSIRSYRQAQDDTESGTDLLWVVYTIVKLKLNPKDDLRQKIRFTTD